MFKSTLKVAIRALRRDKVYSLINVLGLAIGLAAAFLVVLFIRYELSYDRYHKNADRIYRVAAEFLQENGMSPYAGSPGPLAPALQADLPGTAAAVRIFDSFNATNLVRQGAKKFYEQKIFYADPEFFQIFSFEFVQGDPSTALRQANAIVITEEMARKYFGDRNPLHQTLIIRDRLDFTVTGVIRNVPANSHFTFDFIAAFASLDQVYSDNFFTYWGAWNFYTYILLAEGAEPETMEANLPAFKEKYFPASGGMEVHRLLLQPLTDIHLHSHLRNEIAENGDVRTLYFFAIIAAFILLIACINFMNLSTARAMTRAREVAIRKVVGARRTQLIGQFLGESLCLSLVAFPVALLLLEFILPGFNTLVNRNLQLDQALNWQVMAFFTGLLLLVGVVSGSYPAFFLSALRCGTILKKGETTGSKGQRFRRALVVFQFAAAICLITATGVVHEQLNLVQTKDLGIHKEQVLLIPLKSDAHKKYEVIKQEFSRHANVLGTSASSFTPSGTIWHEGFSWHNDEHSMQIDRISVDADFIKLFGAELLAGRNFSNAFANDPTRAYMLNRAAVTHLGWTPESAIGQKVAWNGRVGTVVGVLKDFHYKSLHHRIEPLLLTNRPSGFNHLAVKISGSHISQTVALLRESWERVVPHHPFESFFFDDDFDRLYKAEMRLGHTFASFSMLAIFIACLGLVGLAAYAAEQRTKEIGIRKVLGATVSNVTALLSKDFVKLVLLANLIAWPVAWVAMNKWLETFAYRIAIDWWVFVLAGALALFIALLTVSTQAVRAALANPVEALRYE